MPTVGSKTECAALGCHRTTANKYCDKHKGEGQKRKRSRKGSDYRPYKTPAWLAMRAKILQRDPVCKGPGLYGDGCSQPSKHVDHITPWKQGGAFLDPKNLQGLCHSCHSKKTKHGQ